MSISKISRYFQYKSNISLFLLPPKLYKSEFINGAKKSTSFHYSMNYRRKVSLFLTDSRNLQETGNLNMYFGRSIDAELIKEFASKRRHEQNIEIFCTERLLILIFTNLS